MKYGKQKHHLYKTWLGMMERCYKKYSPYYNQYGAIGITVDESWHNFENFCKDMVEKPDSTYQLDRKDLNSGYSKENCRWATRSQNLCNRSKFKNSLLKYKGIKLTSSGKYQASIRKDKKYYYLGLYKTQEEAALAYDEMAKILHGEYALLNFPQKRGFNDYGNV